MKDPAKRLPDTNTILRYLLGDEPRLYEKDAKVFEKVRTGEEKVVILEKRPCRVYIHIDKILQGP